MKHRSPDQSRRPADHLPMDEQTQDLADTIEGALVDVGGDSPLYRVMADHAARAVQGWIDYMLQSGELRMISLTHEIGAADESPTTPIRVVQ
jgi:hypothetical protein